MKFSILSVLLCLFMVDVAVSLNKQRDCKCRTELRRGRIIGGRKADRIYPWMVSLQDKKWDSHLDTLRRFQVPIPEQIKVGLHFCGGVLINENWVLTAAHCIEYKKTDGFRVGYGDDLVTIFDRNQYAEVEAVYKHPKFSFQTIFNDLALVQLARPLKFNETVQPACLAADYCHHYEGVLKITGFGRTSKWIEGEERFRKEITTSRYLKEGNTYDVSYGWHFPKELMIRVENRYFGTLITPCHGDSGGPLQHMQGARSTVIGIGSTAETTGYGEEKVYCVGNAHFTRVSAYLDWIKETVGDEICL